MLPPKVFICPFRSLTWFSRSEFTNLSQICYCGQISLQSAAVNCTFSDNLTPLGVTFILLAMVHTDAICQLPDDDSGAGWQGRRAPVVGGDGEADSLARHQQRLLKNEFAGGPVDAEDVAAALQELVLNCTVLSVIGIDGTNLKKGWIEWKN